MDSQKLIKQEIIDHNLQVKAIIQVCLSQCFVCKKNMQFHKINLHVAFKFHIKEHTYIDTTIIN